MSTLVAAAIQPDVPVAVTERAPRLVTPLLGLLNALGNVIERVSDDQYRARPFEPVSGSVGMHVRHCLDHIAAVVDGLPDETLDYERRVRGGSVEHDRAAALRAIGSLAERLLRLPVGFLDRPLTARVAVAEGRTLDTLSTVGRELSFVVSHTVHHQALIAVLLAQLGVAVPERFGYAPGTPRSARQHAA